MPQVSCPLNSKMNDMAWLSVIVVGLAVVTWIAWHALRPDGRRWPSARELYPECLYRVSITDDEIQVAQPNGNTEKMPLRTLVNVVVETNDSGPGGADVWWHWYGEPQTVCSYPQGATGEDRALAFVQTLDRFNHDALQSAMACTSNRTFVVYQRAV